jgi:hypothetical protein
MAENKPEGRQGKASYIAPAIMGAIVVALVVLNLPEGQKPVPAPVPKPEARAAAPADDLAPVVATPPVLTAPPVLTRNDLLETARRVAAQFAAEGRMTAATADLVKRRFSLRMAFGCDPAQAAPGVLQTMVQPNEERGSITLTARPALWADLPLVQSLSNRADIEVVEGFWIPRPWAASENCPPAQEAQAPAVATPPSAQTVGLARFFGPGESRAQRHAEHPYQFTFRRPSSPATSAASFYLQLEGELSAFADGNALNCWAESSMHRPVCLYSVIISRVAFVSAPDGSTLAQWDR